MKEPKVFRFFNQVLIVDNGIKTIFNDKNITSKTDDEILEIYHRKCGETDRQNTRNKTRTASS